MDQAEQHRHARLFRQLSDDDKNYQHAITVGKRVLLFRYCWYGEDLVFDEPLASLGHGVSFDPPINKIYLKTIWNNEDAQCFLIRENNDPAAIIEVERVTSRKAGLPGNITVYVPQSSKEDFAFQLDLLNAFTWYCKGCKDIRVLYMHLDMEETNMMAVLQQAGFIQTSSDDVFTKEYGYFLYNKAVNGDH